MFKKFWDRVVSISCGLDKLFKAVVVIGAFTSLSGCAVSTVTYKIKSSPGTAKIEVNGRERCSETPCSVELICKMGVFGTRTSSVFVAAFPKTLDPQSNPQSIYKPACTNGIQSEEIDFDLSQPKVGDFESGSHVPSLLRRYFSFASTTISSTGLAQTPYKLQPTEFSFGKHIFTSDNLKIWSYISVFYGKDESEELESINPSTFGISNIYQFHSTYMEPPFVFVGPIYFHQYNGDRTDVFGIYTGAGIYVLRILNFQNLYESSTRFKTGDLNFDLYFSWGYVFPFNSIERNYEKRMIAFNFYF